MSKPLAINFGFNHEDAKLWALNLPAEEMSLSELETNLDIAYLDQEGTDDWNLTLRQLIAEPEKETGHYKKIKAADLSYPIHIYFFQGSWKILDGTHRFCKAVLEGRRIIEVKKVTDEMIPGVLKEASPLP